MADRRAQRLARMSSASKTAFTKKGTEFPTHSRYSSLIDMINTRRDEYPLDANLEVYDHGNNFHDRAELGTMNKLYNVKYFLTL